MVRYQSLLAWAFALVAVATVSGQTSPQSGGKIVCRLLSSIRLVKRVQPVYPEAAKQGHIEGKVSLHCIVAKDGSVKKLEVVNGHPLLAKAATDAVSQWRYKPTRLNGQAVEVDTTVDVIFQITKESEKSRHIS